MCQGIHNKKSSCILMSILYIYIYIYKDAHIYICAYTYYKILIQYSYICVYLYWKTVRTVSKHVYLLNSCVGSKIANLIDKCPAQLQNISNAIKKEETKTSSILAKIFLKWDESIIWWIFFTSTKTIEITFQINLRAKNNPQS